MLGTEVHSTLAAVPERTSSEDRSDHDSCSSERNVPANGQQLTPVEDVGSPTKSSPKKKAHMPQGFVCICTHKSVQLDTQSHFCRDTHDKQLHEEMEAELLKTRGANVQTMYLPGGGVMAVNPSKNLVVGARSHRMAVFLGTLNNYDHLVAKHDVQQPKGSKKGKARVLNAAELVCVLYSKMGLSMLSELQGKFAFCMYDPRLVRVLAVRDPQGTFPVVQAYTDLDNLIIVCGPYLPAGHREVIELQPSEYKYGWHAPPLPYDGILPPQEPQQPAGTGNKRNRRRRKAAAAAAEAAAAGQAAAAEEGSHEETPEQQAQPDGTALPAPTEAPASGPAEQGDAAQARKSRRRRPRRRGPSTAGPDPAATDATDATATDAIVLPDTLDCEDSAPQPPQEAGQDGQQEAAGAAPAAAARPARRQRRRGSRRTSLDTASSQDGTPRAADAPAPEGDDARGADAAAACPKQHARRGINRRVSFGADQVWVAKPATPDTDAAAPADSVAAEADQAAVDAHLSRLCTSHKISVGQDLDSMAATPKVAALSPASPGAPELLEAVAAMTPSRSCGELKGVLGSGGQPAVVC